ncbi:MAG: DUF4956 domain-containing protein [Planctomycetes bacterium]|nr:DUF4956 domain-containing protein [Planctomycetota bacterium]
MIAFQIGFDWLRTTATADGEPALADIALRIGIAAALGAGVALLYRASRDPDERQPGFAHTLVLLAPLIAMVTVAVGQNVAAAFTLVGTLAIVRFRAALKDTRDMAFVIFSVAVGMALGRTSKSPGAVIRIVIAPPDPGGEVWGAVVSRYVDGHTVVKSSIDRKAGELDLRLSVRGLDPARVPALLAELVTNPAVVRASFAPDEDA